MRLIDADALYDRVEESRQDNPHKDPKVMVNHINEHGHFLDMIIEAPTVDAEPVRLGRWIHYDYDIYRCSECRSKDSMRTVAWNVKKFCPWCGAKMSSEIQFYE